MTEGLIHATARHDLEAALGAVATRDGLPATGDWSAFAAALIAEHPERAKVIDGHAIGALLAWITQDRWLGFALHGDRDWRVASVQVSGNGDGRRWRGDGRTVAQAIASTLAAAGRPVPDFALEAQQVLARDLAAWDIRSDAPDGAGRSWSELADGLVSGEVLDGYATGILREIATHECLAYLVYRFAGGSRIHALARADDDEPYLIASGASPFEAVRGVLRGLRAREDE